MKNKIPYILAAAIMLSIFGCDREERPFPEERLDFNVIDFEPAWSPDGQWIAYYHSDRPGYSGIYLIRPDGTENQLWHAGAVETPAWSPCGQWIAFSQNAQIWKKKIDGDSLTQLTFYGRNFFPAYFELWHFQFLYSTANKNIYENTCI